MDWYLFERYDCNHWSAVEWIPKKKRVKTGEENLVVNGIHFALVLRTN